MNVPDPLLNIDLQRTLRRRGIIRRYGVYRKNYESAKKLIAKNLTHPIQKEEAISPYFSNEAINNLVDKRIHLVNIREENFKKVVEQYLGKLEEKVISNIRTPKAIRSLIKKDNEDLFDREDQVNTAIDLFTPLLNDIAAVAGSEAYKLINAHGAYIPKASLRSVVQQEVEKFANSLLDTDQERLTNVITSAFESGSSVAEVQSQVADVFVDIKKYQSERIARTELLRASNYGQLDAYKQSEVVSGMQWLVDGNPCPECIELDGKIISLDDTWFDQGDSFMSLNFDYGSVDAPPLHPNCECTIIPVLVDTSNGAEEMQQEITELKTYISDLEKIAGISNENGE